MKTLKCILSTILLLSITGYLQARPFSNARLMMSETSDRHLSGFNAIDLAGPFDVYIKQGSTESVNVDAPHDVIDRVITEVNNGILKIYTRHDTWNWGNWWGNHKKIIVYVEVKDINSINISGSGDIYFKEGITANSLKLRISGSGDILGKVNVKMLDSSISGSGDMKLWGKAEESTVRIVGSGDFTAHDLVTISTNVHLTGSGDARINASEKIAATVNGSGDVHYSGAARNISSSKSGSGDISRD